jgi:hypothetical protein
LAEEKDGIFEHKKKSQGIQDTLKLGVV